MDEREQKSRNEECRKRKEGREIKCGKEEIGERVRAGKTEKKGGMERWHNILI